MFRLVSKLLNNRSMIDSKACYVRYIGTLTSVDSATSSKPLSVTLSYLTNTCGLSPHRAATVSKRVLIRSTDKADLVLQLLRANGFTKTQITTIISNVPHLILADPKKTLQHKIAYFESLGIAGPELRNIMCVHTGILKVSLKKRILPTIDYLRVLLKTDEDAIFVFKRFPPIIACGAEVISSNICTLRALGVPEPSIRRLIVTWPRSLSFRVDIFGDAIREAKELGCEPTSKSFIYALNSIVSVSKSKWESKRKVLMSFGWSERDFLMAFRASPFFMTASEKKMKQSMEFYLTKACLQLTDLVRRPLLFKISLERTVIPRCSVLEVLMSKGLINKNVDVVLALSMTRKRFEDKFLACFKEDCPELIQAYYAKTFQGFGKKCLSIKSL